MPQPLTTLRRTSTTLPGSVTVTNGFGSGGSINDTASRVAMLTQGGVDVATYDYLGAGQVINTNLGTTSTLNSTVFDSSNTTYPHLDQFNRITSSRWTKGADLYRVDLTYDRNSSITLAQDYVHTWTSGNHLFDAAYTMDNLNRLTRAYEGHWDTGLTPDAINSSADTRDEQWTALSQTGNWERRKLDLNADADFTDASELDDTGTFNVANEWSTRDTDSNASVNYTLTHNAVGELTDDGQSYKYVYDAFGRLVTVKNQSNATVAEYKYNGLGYRISWHYDADADTDIDGNDPTYYFAYDDRWRTVATFRGSDANAKERFTFHNAGYGGRGGSSYIDLVVLRDRDANTNWVTTAGDGTLEERNYYCQNWRADVSVIVATDATPIEWIKYSAYGVPTSYALADFDRDGDIDSADQTAWFYCVANGSPGSSDIDYDGDFATSDDDTAFLNSYNAASTGGRGVLSRSVTASTLGYGGYLRDACTSLYHVRARAYRADLGRWTARDPVFHKETYSYCGSSPVGYLDPSGLKGVPSFTPGAGQQDEQCEPYLARGTTGIGYFEGPHGSEYTSAWWSRPVTWLTQYRGRLDYSSDFAVGNDYFTWTITADAWDQTIARGPGEPLLGRQTDRGSAINTNIVYPICLPPGQVHLYGPDPGVRTKSSTSVGGINGWDVTVTAVADWDKQGPDTDGCSIFCAWGGAGAVWRGRLSVSFGTPGGFSFSASDPERAATRDAFWLGCWTWCCKCHQQQIGDDSSSLCLVPSAESGCF